MRIEWDNAALRDRERIFEFLYIFNPQAAVQADNEIDKAVKRLLEHPELGKTWHGKARKLLINKASLLLVYIIVDDVIKVFAIAHQREKFPN
ncbi:addiction module toxin, RelE/StbE family [Serratia sp. AS12]|uniref:type II toxin-antitoxin system RelE/ParE family toxin n=1 Tax=Serratia TaxID=613 RepID=UPI00020E91FE|nr:MULTISPECIES: type II toxin-antitoxin system mRNA interferase toxin, RelE/StbE family [Serratia]AEF43624.1 addiction module toxin, RelE/StbE family [Serratia plymuthica AS9]AEF48576.1 addiction module toxin, RelE/StbE family [Serratia sp. AS12]AEG26284.1 addiction module toxin, RelE/StbE family [Serratia sp. AS13]UTN97179.1 type II toxin-antitoxin system mRNA interferase toxin, RelE/StbE family [Serratia plymuthica]VEA61917.1 addiction module toxin, RelE/StbE family [Serratia plymuthica]